MIASIQAWLTFWQAIFAIGVIGFFCVVVVTTPLGVRDIQRLFEKLSDPNRFANRDDDDDAP